VTRARPPMTPLSVSSSDASENLSNYTESNRIERVRPQRDVTGAGSSTACTAAIESSSSCCC
jgi:hypothetical protein